MIIDQDEIDALLQQARESTDEPQAARSAAAVARTPRVADVTIQQVRGLRVPIVVRLATKRMSIGTIRRLALGTILEFSRRVDEPLDVCVNNRPVAVGETVRIGEHFGIRITALLDAQSAMRQG